MRKNRQGEELKAQPRVKVPQSVNFVTCELSMWPPPTRNALGNSDQVKVCHFQTGSVELTCWRSALLPLARCSGLFFSPFFLFLNLYIKEGEADSCRCKADTRASFGGLHKGDIHCLCLIRASGTGWDSLLSDGEHCYEDGQSLCSLSETIV